MSLEVNKYKNLVTIPKEGKKNPQQKKPHKTKRERLRNSRLES